MENLRGMIDSIKDISLKKIATREINVIEESANKWSKRTKDMVQKGWCFIDDRRELYDLLLKETVEAQKDVFSIDFWVERWGEEGFCQRLLARNKELVMRKDRAIKLSRFFILSKEVWAKDKTKEIIRIHRRELIADHNKADIVVILRTEFRAAYPEICKFLQHITIFDENLTIVELSDQFGETTGTGPIIGREVIVSEQEKRETGVLGGASKYLNIMRTLQELSTKKESFILRII